VPRPPRPGAARPIALLAAALGALAASRVRAEPPQPPQPPQPRPSASGTANPAEALETPTVTVVGTTPLPGLGTAIEQVPANVQIYTSRDLDAQQPSSLSEYLAQNATSISVNDAQGNPFQPDILFRGFSASPLLGTPEGISVFQDGVRINEPFGDVVNWDLVPEAAIADIQLVPGSNPVFGLNTLGGSLALYTKSGAQYPGLRAEVSAGSFGRTAAEMDYGGASSNFDYFVSGNYSDDHGWADHNPSHVEQLFAKVGWQTERTNLDVSLTAADNSLQGTQTLPQSFLGDIYQAYTWPDTQWNRLAFLTARGSQFLADRALLGATLYYRHYTSDSVSSNLNSDYGSIDPATGMPDAIEAFNDAARIDQDGYGGGVQLTLTGAPAGLRNQLILGASGDFGDALYTQQQQNASLTADRGTIASGPLGPLVDADTRSGFVGVFATDTLRLSHSWAITVSARYDHSEISIRDRSGNAPQLDGTHGFSRLNPALGVTFNPGPALTVYATYNVGARAPTAIELTCADPAAPCSLPNEFVSDPPLKQVVGRTLEAGARGTAGPRWQWSAALYRTDLSNDIQFISSGATALTGYYANVGHTRRQGVELAAQGHWGSVGVSAHYTYTAATYRSTFDEFSPDNSSADVSGAILVQPGDHLAGVPAHNLKLRLDASLGPRLTLGVNLVIASSVYARGDENNQDIHGPVPGYALLSLDAHYHASSRWQFFARVNNLVDRRYSNFGILAENSFTGPNESFGPALGIPPRVEQFRAPGAPIGAWAGVSYALDRPVREP